MPQIDSLQVRSWPEWRPVMHLTMIGVTTSGDPIVVERAPIWAEHCRMRIETATQSVWVHVCGVRRPPEAFRIALVNRLEHECLIGSN